MLPWLALPMLVLAGLMLPFMLPVPMLELLGAMLALLAFVLTVTLALLMVTLALLTLALAFMLPALALLAFSPPPQAERPATPTNARSAKVLCIDRSPE